MSVSIIRDDGQTLTLDGTFREQWSQEQRATDHPIEDGSTVTDHLQPLPRSLTLDCSVTETPLGPVSGLTGAERVLAARDFLDGCRQQVLSVVTSRFGTLENMALITWTYNITSARSLPLTLRFRELEFAETGSVQIPADAPTEEASDGAPDATDSGTQSTTTVDDDEAEEDKSILASLVDAF